MTHADPASGQVAAAVPASCPVPGEELGTDAEVLLQRQTEVLELIAATAPLRTTLDLLLVSLPRRGSRVHAGRLPG